MNKKTRAIFSLLMLFSIVPSAYSQNVDQSVPIDATTGNLMKYITRLVFICFAIISASAFGNTNGQEVQALRVWQKYLDYPSTENAAVVYQELSRLPRGYSEENAKLVITIFKNIGMIERQIYSGDANAAKVAFRLHTIADGVYQETLDIILGELIRINPRLFLDVLKNQRSNISSLGHLVGNFGPEYVDKMEAHNMERDLRVKALQTITDPSLVSLRDECVAALLE